MTHKATRVLVGGKDRNDVLENHLKKISSNHQESGQTVPLFLASSPLERRAEEFYAGLTPAEVPIVQAVVSDIKTYLEPCGHKGYVIAGVGSILRAMDPTKANDIDLAVCNVFTAQGSGGFDPVRHFTTMVHGYFTTIANRLVEIEHIRNDFDDGSGPYEGQNEGLRGKISAGRTSLDVLSDIGIFSAFGSKGVQIRYEGIRPIDVQFVKNMSYQAWVDQQTEFSGPGQIYESFKTVVAPERKPELYFARLLVGPGV